jgi:uncharacterized membrane protein
MMFTIIIGVCFVSVWFILYFMMLNNLKPKKNIIIGVTLPHDAHDDPQTKAICGSFKKTLNIVMIPLFLLLIPPFFLHSMGFNFIWFMTWLIFAMASPMIAFAKHREKLMALKRANNWHSAAAGRALVDIKAATLTRKKINSFLFLPPVLAGAFTVFYSLTNPTEFGMTLVYVIFTALVIFFWLLYYLIFRLRAEVVNEDMSMTVELTRMRRYNWGKFFLIASWLTGALSLMMWKFADNMTALLASTFAYTLIIIAVSIYTEFATRIAQQKLTAGNTGDLYLDEDDYWLFGMFYHNPNDNHFFVNDRVGMNMSVNLAKPAGKAVIILTALLILAMPFLGVWMIKEQAVPLKLLLDETTLTARHTSDKYVIQLNSIESVELIEKLPSMIKTGGTNLENLFKGNFRAGGYGSCKVCIRPKVPPFLVIKADDKTYLLNDEDSSVTREAYQYITSALVSP